MNLLLLPAHERPLADDLIRDAAAGGEPELAVFLDFAEEHGFDRYEERVWLLWQRPLKVLIRIDDRMTEYSSNTVIILFPELPGGRRPGWTKVNVGYPQDAGLFTVASCWEWTAWRGTFLVNPTPHGNVLNTRSAPPACHESDKWVSGLCVKEADPMVADALRKLREDKRWFFTYPRLVSVPHITKTMDANRKREWNIQGRLSGYKKPREFL